MFAVSVVLELIVGIWASRFWVMQSESILNASSRSHNSFGVTVGFLLFFPVDVDQEVSKTFGSTDIVPWKIRMFQVSQCHCLVCVCRQVGILLFEIKSGRHEGRQEIIRASHVETMAADLDLFIVRCETEVRRTSCNIGRFRVKVYLLCIVNFRQEVG